MLRPGIVLDEENRRVLLDGAPLELTETEFSILQCLARRETLQTTVPAGPVNDMHAFTCPGRGFVLGWKENQWPVEFGAGRRWIPGLSDRQGQCDDIRRGCGQGVFDQLQFVLT